jgi:hypothetical protein
LKNYIKTALVGLAVCVIVICYESQFFDWNLVGILRKFSDGMFVAGIMLIGMGALTIIASAGFFDAFTFLGNFLVWTFSPRKNAFNKRMKYFDYKLEKEKKRAYGKNSKGEKSYRHIFITGVMFLLLSLVLAFL